MKQGWNSQELTKQDENDATILLYHPYILCHFANHALHAFVFLHGCMDRYGMYRAGE